MNLSNAAYDDNIALDSKIYIAGHNGLVGSSIKRALEKEGYKNIIVRSSKELDLRNQTAVYNFFEEESPEYVFLCAAKVGGIKANMTFPAEFIHDNLAIELNVIKAAYLYQVKKLLFLGSSCIYPRLSSQPISENALLTGALEPTNESYALAKIAGIKLCQAFNKQYKTNFITCMPTNIFGPGDNFNLETAHALPALIAKMHKAKLNNTESVTIWGSGNAMREWLYVEDLAQACIFLMKTYNESDIVNVGTGIDISIKDLAYKIKEIVEYKGKLVFDNTKPEGMPRKLLNVQKINSLGWQSTTGLDHGIANTYNWYKNDIENKN